MLELGLQVTRFKLWVSYRNIADLDAVGFGHPYRWVGNVDVWLVLRVLLRDLCARALSLA